MSDSELTTDTGYQHLPNWCDSVAPIELVSPQ